MDYILSKTKDLNILIVGVARNVENVIENEIKKAKNIIVAENSATSQISDLITEKTGIKITENNKILSKLKNNEN